MKRQPRLSTTLIIFTTSLLCWIIPISAQQSGTTPIPPRGGVQGGIGQFGQGGFGGQRGGFGGQRGGIGQQGIGQRGQGQGGIGQGGSILGGARQGGGTQGQGGGGADTSGSTDTPVETITGSGPGIRTVGGGTNFEPVQERDLEYVTLPTSEEFDVISELGPMPVTQFLDTIQISTGWNILATAGVQALQTPFFQINDLAPGAAMEILKLSDIFYEFDEKTNFLRLMTKEEYLEKEFGKLKEAEFSVTHTSLEDVESILTSLKSAKGRLIVDARTSTIYVSDTQDNIDYMKKTVKEIDVPREKRVFEPLHINVDSLIETIETLITEQGEIRIDPRTNRLLVIDHPSQLERIDELITLMDRELTTRSWVLNYAYVDDIADQISLILPEEMGLITTNEDVHQITVAAVPHRLDQIDTLIKQWDFPRPQVQIDAYLLTASRNVIRNFGINWSYFGEIGGTLVGAGSPGGPLQDLLPSVGQNIRVGQLPAAIPVIDPATGEALTNVNGNPVISEFVGDDLSVAIDYLETEGDVTVLAHPLVVVQDGMEAVFQNITQVPFSQSTADQPIGGFNSNNFRSISRIDFIDVGTTLRVLPRISSDGNILLDIGAEDSSFESVTIQGGGLENDVPQKTKNSTETQVMVRDQETIVIGGLRSSNFTDGVEKIPLLGDLPLLGRLFKSTRNNHQHRDLLIFITPTIVNTSTSPNAVKLAKHEQELAEKMRYDSMTAFQRIKEGMQEESAEIIVSIGQSGDVFTDGELKDYDALRLHFEQTKSPLTTKVVIREHPRAPKEVRLRVAEIAFDADLEVETDDRVVPFVPSAKYNVPESSAN